METLAELIGFIRKRKWVLLILVAVISLAFVPEGRIFLLYALCASFIGFFSWYFWDYFKVFFSFTRCATVRRHRRHLTINEKIAHLLVFFVVFLAPLFIFLASDIGPASYQKMTASAAVPPDLLEEMRHGVGKAFVAMIMFPFFVFFIAINGGDNDTIWYAPWMAGIIAALLVYAPLLGMYLHHLESFRSSRH